MNYIIIDGVKYVIDPNDKTKALLKDGEKVLYKEPKETPEKKKEREKKEKNKVDLSKVSLDDLKKANPEVAKLLTNMDDMKTKLDKITKDAENAGRKKKEKDGKWQEIAESETTKRKDAEGKATKSDELLNKYKSTVNNMLEGRLKSIDKEKQALIPSDYSARKKLEYIDSNAKILGFIGGANKGGKIDKNDKDVDLGDEDKAQAEYDILLANKERTPLENKKFVELGREIKEIRQENADKT